MCVVPNDIPAQIFTTYITSLYKIKIPARTPHWGGYFHRRRAHVYTINLKF